MNITPKEMIEWFRAKASEFQDIASKLESTFNSNGQPNLSTSKRVAEVVSVEEIKSTLSTLGTARCSKVASSLHVEDEFVRKVIFDNPNLFEQVGRGWWRVKS